MNVSADRYRLPFSFFTETPTALGVPQFLAPIDFYHFMRAPHLQRPLQRKAINRLSTETAHEAGLPLAKRFVGLVEQRLFIPPPFIDFTHRIKKRDNGDHGRRTDYPGHKQT